ncbi:hypothetical protein MRX96_037071 [Rhipicephalus microplus]
MRDEDTLKLIRSLVVSRVTYSLPYQRLTKSEQGQVDAMLRKAYKAALKLPPGTPSSKLLALGLHNTFEELCESQLATQLKRLKQTPTGRDLLLRLGYISQFHDAARRKPIPDQLRATYKVAPIPRNMDPRLHQGRREARVEALERTYAHKNTTYYVDAANYDHANNKAVATVVDHTLTERTGASVRCRNITDAEETAIALALTLGYRQRRSLTVLTDSQAACRNYLQGRISQPTLSVIMSYKDISNCALRVQERCFSVKFSHFGKGSNFPAIGYLRMAQPAHARCIRLARAKHARRLRFQLDVTDAWIGACCTATGTAWTFCREPDSRCSFACGELIHSKRVRLKEPAQVFSLR